MTSCTRGLMSLGLGAAIVAGCGKPGDSRSQARDQGPARPVRIACAELRPMTRAIAVTGTLAAQEKSVLSAKVTGRLTELPVDLGSVVRQGDLLAQIELRDYELGMEQAASALAQARTALGLPLQGEDDRVDLESVSAVRQTKAVLDEATLNRERVKKLSQSGIASQSELDTVEATYKVAVSRYDAGLEEARTRTATVAQRRAEYELARKRLADASVRAPFDGTVQARTAHLGEYVGAGTPILELVKAGPMRLRLPVPERECALVRAGQAVRLFVEGDTNAYTGQIARLSPALDDQTRMLLVEADVPARGSLRPGLFARGHILVDEHQQGLSVPAEALITFAGIEKVVVAQESKALEKVILTGRRGQDWVEVTSGISAGEPVILNPAGIRTGQPVRVMTTAAAALPAATATERAAD